MEDIKLAKELMTESKEIKRKEILNIIKESKDDGKLYCRCHTERNDINVRQMEEIMKYLFSKGYDIYTQEASGNPYITYTIFWDDESNGKYREKGINWSRKENK